MLKRWHKVALALFAIAIVAFAASFLFPVTYQICTEAQNSAKSDCALHHLGAFIVLWIAVTADAHNGLITAIATVLLMGITYMLVQLGREQSRTSRAQLRAYIGVAAARVSIEGVPNASPPPLFERVEIRGVLTVKNRGQTPAFACGGKAGIRWGAAFENRWIDEAQNFPQSSYVLPDGDFLFRTNADLLALGRQRPDDATEQWTFYLFGRFEYRDAFGEDRWTTFRYSIAGDIFGERGGKPTVHPCDEGNDAS